jgi:hypothetical protein
MRMWEEEGWGKAEALKLKAFLTGFCSTYFSGLGTRDVMECHLYPSKPRASFLASYSLKLESRWILGLSLTVSSLAFAFYTFV